MTTMQASNAMQAFLDIPEAPVSKETLHPDIYVEPFDDFAASEDSRQITFVNYMTRDEPHIAVHATPNGGRQTDYAKIRGKRMGVYAGWPDTGIDWDGGDAEIEFKDGRGKPSREQIACLNRLHRMGKNVAICRTAVGAVHWLAKVGAPVKTGMLRL